MRGLSPVAASGGHSSSRCAGLSLSRPLLLRSTDSRRAGSVVVAHGPSCSAAYGIFPDQGSNPCSLHWQADSQPLRHQGSPYHIFLLNTTRKNSAKHDFKMPLFIFLITIVFLKNFGCTGSSVCCLQRMGSLLRRTGFSGCGARASLVVACGLSCPVARWILVPRPGIKPVSPALEGRFLTTGPQGKSLKHLFLKARNYISK